MGVAQMSVGCCSNTELCHVSTRQRVTEGSVRLGKGRAFQPSGGTRVLVQPAGLLVQAPWCRPAGADPLVQTPVRVEGFLAPLLSLQHSYLAILSGRC